MKNKRIEIVSSILFLGLFLPFFASSKHMVGIFTVPACFFYCQDPGSMIAMLFFLVGWFVLLIDSVRVHLMLYQKKRDCKVLGQMFFWCMLLVFFRIQNTERTFFGNTYPFIGWWMLMLGIVLKMWLYRKQDDGLASREIRKLLLLAAVILIVSMPFQKVTIRPWFEEDAREITARIGLGGMFFNDIFVSGYMKRYIVYPLRQSVFVLMVAAPLFFLQHSAILCIDRNKKEVQ